MRTHFFTTMTVAALLATVLFNSQANAQTNIFVRVDGIDGEATDDKHKDWIEVLAVTETLKGGLSSASGRASGTATVESFTITKRLDKSSPSLKLNLMQGKQIPDVTIEYCKSAGSKTKFYTITLKNVVITSIRNSDEKGISTEEISFGFGSIEWSYVPIDSSGKASAAVKAGWDLKVNKKI